MSQVTDYTIDNSTGANVRSDINAVLGAIATNNSGSSAPSTTFALGFFANETDNMLQLRNAANSAFVNLRGFDGKCPIPDGTKTAPSLFFDDDDNTGIFTSAADTFNIATGGVERMELGTTTIFNEDGADVDFRIESDDNANMFFVDAGNNQVIIGSSSSIGDERSDNFTISESTGNAGMQIEGKSSNSNYASIYLGDSNNKKRGFLETQLGFNGEITLGTVGTGAIRFVHSDTSESMRIDGSTGNLGIGTSSPDRLLHLESDGASIIRLTDSDTNGENFSTIGMIEFETRDTNGAGVSTSIRSEITDTTNGACNLAFSTGTPSTLGTRMIIDSTGALGLGVTPKNNSGNYRQLQIGFAAHFYGRTDDSPLYLLSNGYRDGSDWKYTGNTTASQMEMGTNIIFSTAASGTANDAITFDEQLRVTSSGIGIGTSNPEGKLHVSDTYHFTAVGGNSATGMQIGNYVGSTDTYGVLSLRASTHRFNISGNTRMIITSNGDVIIGEDSAIDGSKLGVKFDGSFSNGLVLKTTRTATGSDFVKFLNSDGNVAGKINHNGTTTVNYVESSDYRLKENAVAISDGITRLKTLKPYRFNFKSEPDRTVDGFFAHEVTAVPEAITGTKDEVDADNKPVYQGIDKGKLVPLLVAAVQELIGKVEALETA